MEAALIPYSVNAPLWSDGAYKERWLGLPGADSKIDFTRSRGWNFPDQTVLVKSFALEMEEGNPQSRRWIETRFLTRQQGEWFGYSYHWNDEQTEGTLVESARVWTASSPSRCRSRRTIPTACASRTGTIRAEPSAWSATAGPPTSCSASANCR